MFNMCLVERKSEVLKGFRRKSLNEKTQTRQKTMLKQIIGYTSAITAFLALLIVFGFILFGHAAIGTPYELDANTGILIFFCSLGWIFGGGILSLMSFEV